jgi:HSP20 family protein
MSRLTLSRPFGIMRPGFIDDFLTPFSDWFGDGDMMPGLRLRTPAVNITEDDNSYQLHLAAPGMKRSDFKVDIDGDTLTISSEKETETEEKTKRYSRREYGYTSFTRSFTLPDDVNRDRIDAHYEDGILRLTLPRKEEARRKETAKAIPVK